MRLKLARKSDIVASILKRDLAARTLCSAEKTAGERKTAADATSLSVEIAGPVLRQRIMIMAILALTLNAEMVAEATKA